MILHKSFVSVFVFFFCSIDFGLKYLEQSKHIPQIDTNILGRPPFRDYYIFRRGFL